MDTTPVTCNIPGGTEVHDVPITYYQPITEDTLHLGQVEAGAVVQFHLIDAYPEPGDDPVYPFDISTLFNTGIDDFDETEASTWLPVSCNNLDNPATRLRLVVQWEVDAQFDVRFSEEKMLQGTPSKVHIETVDRLGQTVGKTPPPALVDVALDSVSAQYGDLLFDGTAAKSFDGLSWEEVSDASTTKLEFFAFDENHLGPDSLSVVVSAVQPEGDSLSGEGTVQIRTLAQFQVRAFPEEVVHGGLARFVRLRPLDAEGVHLRTFNKETVTLQAHVAAADSLLGGLVRLDDMLRGDTTTVDTLSFLFSEDVYLRYRANGAAVETPEQATITVAVQDRADLAGQEVVTVEPAYFTIAPRVVSPGERTTLAIQARDRDAPDFDDNFLIELWTVSNLGYLASAESVDQDRDSTWGWSYLVVPYAAADTAFARSQYGTLQGRVEFVAYEEPDLIEVDPMVSPEEVRTFYVNTNLYGVGDFTKEGAQLILVEKEPKLTLTYSQDPQTYLPLEDDVIEVTAKLNFTPAAGSVIKFELTQSDDFVFADSTTGAKEVAVVGDSVSVEVRSLTYWGVVKVKASHELASGRTLSAEQQLPEDTDGDGIADSWELDPANGGSLALGGSTMDQDWDEEISPGNTNNGDGFTKLGEYQGVTIGPTHMRMVPMKKEVFFDIRNASEGSFAISEVESQLQIEIYEVEGIDVPLTIFPGPRPLKWLGVNAVLGYGNFAHVEDAGIPFASPSTPVQQHKNGEVVQGSVYTLNGSKTQPFVSRGGHTFGDTRGATAGGGARIRIYEGVIANIWNNNDIAETESTTFEFRVAETSGPFKGFDDWSSMYNGSDLNSNGSVGDPINPFDLLSSGSANDALDGQVAGLLQQQYLELNTLHELGHALGIANRGTCPAPDPDYHCHPLTGNSVMRSGFGPAKVRQFSPAEIAQMNLK